jgi:hypothetical protein
MRTGFLFLFFSACLSFGYWVSKKAFDGQVYVYLGSERSPAAVRSLHDYQPVPERSLSQSAQEQLLADAKLVKQEGYLGIHLGHILVRDENGAREFACQARGREGIYDRIELTFMGEGIAEGDGPAKMIIDSRCASESSLERLDTIWIPMQEILSLKPKDQDLQSRGEDPTFIKMQSVPSQWPSQWVLYSVKLYRRSGQTAELKIGTAELLKARPLSFDWSAGDRP